jgi:methyl acetate hydrolase
MDSLQHLDNELRAAAESGRVPGVVAVAGDRDGSFYEAAYGTRGTGDGAAMTVDTVFWLASMTKAITSTAAMQLVEQGRLQLDTPISGVLPQLAAPQVLEGWDDAGKPMLRLARRPITLRHLLTHTAGFGYSMWEEDILRYMTETGIPGPISCQNIALTAPLLHDPGDRWRYGINIDFVGKAVEAVSGQDLESYVRAHITGPLGMQDTGYLLGPEQRERLVAMHARLPEATAPIEFEVPQQPEFHMGGGGMYGTAPDYLRFARAILRGGELDGARILSPETVALMGQNHIGDLEVQTLRAVETAVTNDANFYPGMVQKWGLGFLLNTERDPYGRSPNSLAWAGLGNTYFWIDPTAGVAGVVLTQLFPFADAESLACLWALERGVYERA